MDEYTISLEQAVGALIGGIPGKYSVDCETYHDNDLLKHRLPKAAHIAEKVIFGMVELASTWRDDGRGSAKKCADYCDNELAELAEYMLSCLPMETAQEIMDKVREGWEYANDCDGVE